MPIIWGSSKKTKIILAILAFVLLFLQYGFWFGGGGLVETFRLKGKIRQQKARNDELLKSNEALAREIEALKINNEAIEERARNELGMVKRGEVFYQVVDEERKK